MTLIHGWKTWHKWWSTRLKALGTILVSLAAAIVHLPEHLLYAWSIVPDDIKQTFPSGWVSTFGIILVIGSGFAQLFRQKDAHRAAESERLARNQDVAE